MRRLLNTLYVTIPEAYLSCEGENVLVKVNNEIKFRIPIHNLEGIVCFGFAGSSPGLMYLCCERGVALSFLTEYGKFMGRITGRITGNILLRRAQYNWTEDPEISTRLAKRFVTGKVVNCRAVLNRLIRDHADSVDVKQLKKTIEKLTHIISVVENANTVDSIRGLEGIAANLYFGEFNQLVLTQKETFSISSRNRRPPQDQMNALLSFLYTLLTHEMTAALESVGLDPQAGFLHRDRPGRQSLALDLIEELRPYYADRLALTLVNRKQISSKGFVVKENGAVVMDEQTRKEVLTEWQKRKQDSIMHPYLEEKVTFGLIPYIQAMLLARHIRGDLEDYPPFIWK